MLTYQNCLFLLMTCILVVACDRASDPASGKSSTGQKISVQTSAPGIEDPSKIEMKYKAAATNIRSGSVGNFSVIIRNSLPHDIPEGSLSVVTYWWDGVKGTAAVPPFPCPALPANQDVVISVPVTAMDRPGTFVFIFDLRDKDGVALSGRGFKPMHYGNVVVN